MVDMIKAARREMYLKGHDGCPFCGVEGKMMSDTVVAHSNQNASRNTICHECGMNWYDIYTINLVDIQEA
jgi:transcriptional regulator NrdR family protein